jgi:hypothetical protein
MMNYSPVIESARTIGKMPLGDKHAVVLLDQIVPTGMIRYTYILVVFEKATAQPCYFVASEVNAMSQPGDGASHFLGVFEGNGHLNMGASDDWGDARKFFPKALSLAADHFGVKLPVNEG